MAECAIDRLKISTLITILRPNLRAAKLISPQNYPLPSTLCLDSLLGATHAEETSA